MNLLIHKITRMLSRLSDFLIAFGPFGLFAVALLDSTFVPLPSSADALMLLLSAANPRWMVFYAVLATSGSALGCLILYLVARRAGVRALAKFSEPKQKRVKALIDRYDMIAVLVASLLPPPFPFKLFVVSAGVFRFSVMRFMIAIVSGRGIRFLLVGYFALLYGERAKAVLARYYPWIGLGLALTAILIFVSRSLLRQRRNPTVEHQLE
ncbi:MAG TPA: VTT domain-containing protein [Pyrinomonadaceae bacterium]|nr:VTT domain-containing protein [Pyrinomonadaceae bacterium]HLE63509.1 VTT domain-containing protein [Pyrinomonadaceae bacterium]